MLCRSTSSHVKCPSPYVRLKSGEPLRCTRSARSRSLLRSARVRLIKSFPMVGRPFRHTGRVQMKLKATVNILDGLKKPSTTAFFASLRGAADHRRCRPAFVSQTTAVASYPRTPLPNGWVGCGRGFPSAAHLSQFRVGVLARCGLPHTQDHRPVPRRPLFVQGIKPIPRAARPMNVADVRCIR